MPRPGIQLNELLDLKGERPCTTNTSGTKRRWRRLDRQTKRMPAPASRKCMNGWTNSVMQDIDAKDNALREAVRYARGCAKLCTDVVDDACCAHVVKVCEAALTPNAALRGAEGVPLESTVMQEENMTDVILENPNGVQILESVKFHGHYGAANATCQCGEELIVAPPIFHPDHKKGDPVMVCGVHGVHGYRFSTLVVGRQPTGRSCCKALSRTPTCRAS